MQNYRILLNELPPEGREFHLDDQAIWQNSIEEFQMDCRITKPLSASISVLPTDGGWLVRGSLTGEVAGHGQFRLVLPIREAITP